VLKMVRPTQPIKFVGLGLTIVIVLITELTMLIKILIKILFMYFMVVTVLPSQMQIPWDLIC